MDLGSTFPARERRAAPQPPRPAGSEPRRRPLGTVQTESPAVPAETPGREARLWAAPGEVQLLSEERRQRFTELFFPMIYGIYPYTHATEKQAQAMEQAGFVNRQLPVYELAYRAILKLL